MRNFLKEFLKMIKDFLPILISSVALFLANATFSLTPQTDIALEIFIEETMKELNFEDQEKISENILFRRQKATNELHTFELDEEDKNNKEEKLYNTKLKKLDEILDDFAVGERKAKIGVEGILILLAISVFVIFCIQLSKNIGESKRKPEKIKLVRDLIANKNAIIGDNATKAIKENFNKTIYLVPFIFHDNKKIAEQHDKFYQSIQDRENQTENFYELVVLLFKEIGLKEPTYDEFTRVLNI